MRSRNTMLDRKRGSSTKKWCSDRTGDRSWRRARFAVNSFNPEGREGTAKQQGGACPDVQRERKHHGSPESVGQER